MVLRVNATYKDRSSSNKTALELVFQEAVVSDVRISEFTEMLLSARRCCRERRVEPTRLVVFERF